MSGGNPTYLNLTPRDPLIARDGRPFDAGQRMRPVDWYYPSVLAGSLRTMLGNGTGGFPAADDPRHDALIKALKQVSVAGPFPCVDGQLHFPAPQDVAVRRNQDETIEAFGARPIELSSHGGGCDLPDGLEPVMLPDEIGDEFKPEQLPAFWSCEQMTRWLLDPAGRGLLGQETSEWPTGFLAPPKTDVRTHVQMDRASGVGKVGMLFQTVGLDLFQFPLGDGVIDLRLPQPQLAVRALTEDKFHDWLNHLDTLSPLGGERRLVRWQAGDAARGWTCPDAIRQELGALGESPRKLVRCILATAAIFRHGWRPDWLHKETTGPKQTRWTGIVPETDVHVRLVAACVNRWRPISGWGYEHGKVGSKPVRRLVPAGSVYFLELLDDTDPAGLADRWLQSICDTSPTEEDQAFIGDGDQNRRDGFGLALWGVWQPHLA